MNDIAKNIEDAGFTLVEQTEDSVLFSRHLNNHRIIYVGFDREGFCLELSTTNPAKPMDYDSMSMTGTYPKPMEWMVGSEIDNGDLKFTFRKGWIAKQYIDIRVPQTLSPETLPDLLKHIYDATGAHMRFSVEGSPKIQKEIRLFEKCKAAHN